MIGCSFRLNTQCLISIVILATGVEQTQAYLPTAALSLARSHVCSLHFFLQSRITASICNLSICEGEVLTWVSYLKNLLFGVFSLKQPCAPNLEIDLRLSTKEFWAWHQQHLLLSFWAASVISKNLSDRRWRLKPVVAQIPTQIKSKRENTEKKPTGNRDLNNCVRASATRRRKGCALKTEDVWPSEEAEGGAGLLQDAEQAWHPGPGLDNGLSWVRCLGPWASWHLCQHPPLLTHLPIAKEEYQEIVLVRSINRF